MSGALGKANNSKEQNCNINDVSQLLDSNWVLSRSVPNSLNITNVIMSNDVEIEEETVPDEVNIYMN